MISKYFESMIKSMQMYTREILPPITSPINDGNPVIGTWKGAFEKVDLREIRQPFRYPAPDWIKDFRIKEWQYFSAHDNSFVLEAYFCNFKLYRMAQVLLYDKEKKEKFVFRKIKPGTGKHLPYSLANSSMDNHASHFFFRIHNWLDADTVRLDINIEATRKNPSLTVHMAYNLNSQEVTPITVSLGFSPRTIMCAYKALAPVNGDIVFAGQHIHMNQNTCSGFFTDYKGFFPYRMQTTTCSAAGFDDKNRRFGFHIAENQTRETNKNNENVLWVDGKATPLPPVLITMPNGPDADWVIQDIEGMVDLTFTPKEPNRNGTNLLFTRSDFNAPLGIYNGVLVNSEGEQIQIKNFFGVGEKLYLRV